MTDTKLTGLVERTIPALTDWLYDVPVGAAIGNKITLANLLQNAPSLTFANSHTMPGLTLSATPLAPASGGTGVANNAASTLAISGNFATTLTVTGATGVTLPTSGTLLTTTGSGAGLTGIVTSAIGTANQVVVSGATGAVTFSLPQSIATASTPQFARLGLGAAADAAISLLITGGTVTVSTPVISATQTWNAGGVTFTGLKLNVTSTASAAASLLADLQVSGTSQWNVTKAGQVTQLGQLIVPDGSASAPTLRFTTDSTSGFYRSGTDNITVTMNGVNSYVFAASSIVYNSTSYLGWTTGDPTLTSPDARIYRDAAQTLAQRNGVNAQNFRIYNTFTTLSTNAEWASINWTDVANQFTITTKAGSSAGTTRAMLVGAGTSVGTDIAGSNSTWQAGISTGAGLGGSHIFTVTNKAGTGSSANTLGTVLTLAPPNSGTTAPVNGLTITAAITTGKVDIAATGSDTNISITLTPKGTGSIQNVAGAVATPSYSFAAEIGLGLFRAGSNYMGLAIVGGIYYAFGTTALYTVSGGGLIWTNSTTDAYNGTPDTGIRRSAAGVVEINNGTLGTRKQLYAATLRTDQTTVAGLPAASTAGKGATAFVTDANNTFVLGLGLTAVGGGANNVPVYSDGTNWIVG